MSFFVPTMLMKKDQKKDANKEENKDDENSDVQLTERGNIIVTWIL